MAGRQRAWTQDEEDYLINNYKKLPIKELQKNINRSEKAIRTRANILGLSKSTPLLDYHDRIVSMLDKGKTATEIADALDSTPYSVGRYMRHMKLKTRQLPMNFSKLAIMNGIDDPISFKQENIDKILETYHSRENIDKYAYLASFEEIKENDFNLNIPRFVDTFEDEAPIDVIALAKGIVDIDRQINAVQSDLLAMLNDLTGDAAIIEATKEIFR